MLTAMLCVVWLAASVEGAAAGESTSFVLAYAALRSVLVGLFIRARRHATTARQFCTRYSIGNALGVLIWLASLAVPPPTRYWVWVLGLGVELATPVWANLAIRAVGAQAFHLEHIRERYGLFALIVLGESLLAVAAGTAGTGWAPASTWTGVFGFLAAACLWWIYFGDADTSALALGPRTAFVWGYGHLLVYAGITAVGVGTQLGIEAAGEVGGEGGLGSGARAVWGGGVAAYLLALAFIRGAGRGRADPVLAARLAGAAAAVGLALVGGALPPVLFAAALASLLVALTTFETVTASRSAA